MAWESVCDQYPEQITFFSKTHRKACVITVTGDYYNTIDLFVVENVHGFYDK